MINCQRVIRSLFLAGLTSVAGCGGGDRNIVDPPQVVSDLTLTVRASDNDASVATTLGWITGIPGADVTVSPSDGSAPARSFTTSATGTVAITSLQPGKYRVTVRRLLNASEIATLNELSGAGAFVGDEEINVSSGSATATIKVPASYRTSLVISEWSFQLRFTPGVGSYRYGGFLELYNNSDTTVYLDGVLIADGHSQPTNQPGTLALCDSYVRYQNDPDGVWAQWIAAFPGAGRDYPLAPGKAVVVATDAIDHRAFFADMLDLRSANFEFVGSGDVDNPTVPNMIDRGVREPFFSHGMIMGNALSAVAAIGARVDVGSLVREKLPPNGTEHIRLPRELMLDVFTTMSTWPGLQQPPIALCPELVSPTLDRKYGFFMVEEPNAHAISFSRKILTTSPSGRFILQHTRTSANDFERAPRSPGFVGR